MALKVPPGLNEQAVEHFAVRDRKTGRIADEEVGALASAVKLAREEAIRLSHLEMATLADPTQTREAGLLQLATAAVRSGERIAAPLDAARAKVAARIAEIEKRISAPPAPRDAVALSIESEVRRALAAMSDKDRSAAIDAALKAGDAVVVGAVLRGPALLTGLSDARMGMLRNAYKQRFHAAESERVATLNRALEATDRMGRLFVGLVREATSSPAVHLATRAKEQRETALAAHQQGE